MDGTTQNQSHTLLNVMDRNLRENIIRLDQKLKGLRAEINAKLENSSLLEDEKSRPEYIAKLTGVSQEINDAIRGIETLVNLVSDEDNEQQESFFQGKEMKQFSKMISENLEKITEIKMNF